MKGYTCPHCDKSSISLRQKYLAGKWSNITCNECGGRSCQAPILMVAIYFLYIWDVMLFGTVAYQKQGLFYIGVLLVIWLILDWFTLYIPLLRMKKIESTKTPTEQQSTVQQQAMDKNPEKSD